MKLYLHIGTEKTGTTLLQSFLYKNQKKLSDQGLFLSDVLSKPNNRSLAHYFSDFKDDFWLRHGFKTQEDKKLYFHGFIEKLTEEIRSAQRTHKAMLITSEHFHSRLIDEKSLGEFADFLKGLFHEIKIICYLREQSAVRKSLYSTSLKGNGTQKYSSFDSNVDESSRYYNYYNLVRRWSGAFGSEAMTLRIYDRDRFKDADLRVDFLSLLDGAVDPKLLDFKNTPMNESLSFLQAEAFRAINENCNRFMEKGGFDPVNVNLKKAAAATQELKRGKISDPDQLHFFEIFKKSNENLFREFLPDTSPFQKPAISESNHDEKEFSLNDVAEIVHSVFAEIAKTLDTVVLQDKDAPILRDIALKYERNETLSKSDAINLMSIAARVRSNGSIIRQKLKAWQKDQ